MRRRDFLSSLVAALCLPAAVKAVVPVAREVVTFKGVPIRGMTREAMMIDEFVAMPGDWGTAYWLRSTPVDTLVVREFRSTNVTLPPLSPSHLGSPLGRGAGAALTREETDHGD